MIQDKVIEIIKKANAGYYATYEESSMMNVIADNLKYQSNSILYEERDNVILPNPFLGFAYIEEFTRGSYGGQSAYWNGKTTQLQIWFCKFTQIHENAIERGKRREEIESEIVLPFIEAFKLEKHFKPLSVWNWYTPPPRFDSNEVSIMLEANVTEVNC